nr:uncharacterized protein LOC109188264 isoform X5 [Ipomoea batatas]
MTLSNDADAEDDEKQPSSPSVKKTEEKGISVVHEVKCKLYSKSTDPTEKDAWKDRGTGQLSIKCKEGVSKIARDNTRKNMGTRESKPNPFSYAMMYASVHDGENNDNVVARTCLIRLKSMEDRDKLAEVIEEHAPTA